MPSKTKTSRNIPFWNEQTNTIITAEDLLIIVTLASTDLYCGVWHHDCFTLFLQRGIFTALSDIMLFPIICIYNPLEGLNIFLFQNRLHLKQCKCTKRINKLKLKPHSLDNARQSGSNSMEGRLQLWRWCPAISGSLGPHVWDSWDPGPTILLFCSQWNDAVPCCVNVSLVPWCL